MSPRLITSSCAEHMFPFEVVKSPRRCVGFFFLEILSSTFHGSACNYITDLPKFFRHSLERFSDFIAALWVSARL